ncbi:glycosyltransferase family 2 protein [Patescibacteria group bacterium]
MESYLKVGSASDLKGRDRVIYRCFEMLPGALSWGTLFFVIFFSWAAPIAVSIFIIVFDIYWLLKTAYLSLHLRSSWKKLQHHIALNWEERLTNLHWEHIWQLVILPMYEESYEVVEGACESLMNSSWPKDRMIVVLAIEKRAGQETAAVADRIKEKFNSQFAHFMITSHPDIEGELAGKGSNISWAAGKTREELIDKLNIPYENIIISAFDIDTQVYPQYFLCLAYHFLTVENPHRASFQPVPIYNNNIWDAPALSRVVATSGTFWQMIQQSRPERLTTFSSHSMSFKALCEVGYWQKNIVSEDSRIFWNSLLFFDGDYRVEPLFYPVSMDANLAPTFWKTTKNVYRQQRRWTWGVENVPYLLFGFLKNKKISFKKRLNFSLIQLEGFWSLATNPLLIFLLGWLPLMFGGDVFNTTVLSYNLPRVTRGLMTIAMTGLITSAIISTYLLPKKPEKHRKIRWLSMMIQWILVPFTITLFGAIPGLDAQTRLMFGKYMGFWVTPKHRREIEDPTQNV